MSKPGTQYLQSIIDGIDDPVMVVDNNFQVSFLNRIAQAAARERHFPDSVPCYRRLYGKTAACDIGGDVCLAKEVFRTGRSLTVQRTKNEGGDNMKLLEISASPVFDDNGRICAAVEHVRDITDRAQAKKLLEEQTELNRVFKLVEIAKKEWEQSMDCVRDLVMLTDGAGNIKRCNKGVTHFTGRPYDRLLGENWKKVFMEQGLRVQDFQGERIELYHDRTNRWFVVTTYPVQGIAGNQASGALVMLHDTTDLKRIATQLETTNREVNDHRRSLQSALDELSALIQRVEKEKTFTIRFTNPNLSSCHELMKCKKTQCPCYGKDAMRCWQIAGTYCGGTIQGTYAEKCGSCSDCEVFKAAACTPIFQIGEHFNNMMHILELKNRELEDAYTELKLTQVKILQQEKMASIGQLAAGVAHEINNPMGFISSNLGTLDKYVEKIIKYALALTGLVESINDAGMDEALRHVRAGQKFDLIVEDAKKLIAESLDGAERVKTIVQNLKNFSRVDQAEAKLADINECLESTINIAWNELKYKTTLKKEYGKLPPIRCYPQQLNQVFMNLLVNAAHAIEKQGEIGAKTWEQDGSIFVSISDTGCGIPEKNLTKIFEPFFTTKEVGKGTGLGLSITYEIVQRHNGEIAVSSEPGRGSTFTVRIPVDTQNERGSAP